MAERKVRMWAVWWDGDRGPVEVHRTRAAARVRSGGLWDLRVVRVEVREVPKKKRKVKRGR